MAALKSDYWENKFRRYAIALCAAKKHSIDVFICNNSATAIINPQPSSIKDGYLFNCHYNVFTGRILTRTQKF